MTLWLILAAMSLLAMGMLLWPVLRRPPDQMPRDAYDLEIYRDQFAELDRDVARGLIPEDQAEAARAEVGRRVLAADNRLRDEPEAATAPAPRRWSLIAFSVAAPVLGLLLYVQGGSPRLAGADRSAVAGGADQAQHDIAPLIEKLVERLRESPGNLEGWTMLARTLYSVSRFNEAASAYANALALAPGRADLMSRQAEALSFANNGMITPMARQLFAGAAKADPKNARARYYLALAKLQSGSRREALEDWRALVAGAPPDAPWLDNLQNRVARLEAEIDGGAPMGTDGPRRQSTPAPLGPRVNRPTPGPSAPGPTAGDVEAAQSMSSGARGTMIRSMVQRLADRLKNEPDDAEGWQRLGRAYGVLGERRKSRDAYGKAVKLRPRDLGLLTAYAQSLVQTAALGKSPPELADVAQRILAIDPRNANGLWVAGLTAKEAGDKQAAGRYLRLLLTLLAPDAPERARVRAEIESLNK
jgi:cytochrome c-type biogenesis protein CcmH